VQLPRPRRAEPRLHSAEAPSRSRLARSCPMSPGPSRIRRFPMILHFRRILKFPTTPSPRKSWKTRRNFPRLRCDSRENFRRRLLRERRPRRTETSIQGYGTSAGEQSAWLETPRVLSRALISRQSASHTPTASSQSARPSRRSTETADCPAARSTSATNLVYERTGRTPGPRWARVDRYPDLGCPTPT